ncbi:hypothetical protein ABZS53_15355 [Streptomyces sp. NPDC005499]|uniref:hypothetical protein n=1 Tax=Streptomyces sp. NPDC005499 TaxID=3154883 RepID=UPI0033B8106A
MRQARKAKAFRRQQAARMHKQRSEVAGNFLAICDELLWMLPSNYNCFLTCTEIEAVARLARAFGYDEEDIQGLINDHAEDGECGECEHHTCDDCRDFEGEK